MKVKDLTKRIINCGTNPYVSLVRGHTRVAEGDPDTITENFGNMTVNAFMAVGEGRFKVYVK